MADWEFLNNVDSEFLDTQDSEFLGEGITTVSPTTISPTTPPPLTTAPPPTTQYPWSGVTRGFGRMGLRQHFTWR